MPDRAPTESLPGTPRGHVLVVDDEADIRESLEYLLTREGYSVDTAANAAEGLRQAGSGDYDLLLLDYNCTNFNGMVAIDGTGQIVWYYENDNAVFTVTQEDNHNIVFNELSRKK